MCKVGAMQLWRGIWWVSVVGEIENDKPGSVTRMELVRLKLGEEDVR